MTILSNKSDKQHLECFISIMSPIKKILVCKLNGEKNEGVVDFPTQKLVTCATGYRLPVRAIGKMRIPVHFLLGMRIFEPFDMSGATGMSV